MNTPSKTAQIEALLNGQALDLALKTLGVTDMSDHRYDEVFTVTRRDIDAYVARHGIPRRAYNGAEGFQCVEEEGTWCVYFAERGERVDEHRFATEAEAHRKLLDWLLNSTGAGLDFSHRSLLDRLRGLFR